MTKWTKWPLSTPGFARLDIQSEDLLVSSTQMEEGLIDEIIQNKKIVDMIKDEFNRAINPPPESKP